MSSRSLNKVLLIGNLSQDPELRYTPQGTAVCTFSIATNRSWTDQSGQAQDVAEFTRCVAWAKLAEVCSQLLFKGRKAYVEGRLQTREWEGQDKVKRRTTEVVVESMIALGPAGTSQRGEPAAPRGESIPGSTPSVNPGPAKTKTKNDSKPPVSKKHVEEEDELVPAEDIPF